MAVASINQKGSRLLNKSKLYSSMFVHTFEPDILARSNVIQIEVYGNPLFKRRFDHHGCKKWFKFLNYIQMPVSRQLTRILNQRHKQEWDIRLFLFRIFLDHETVNCKIMSKRLNINIRTLERWFLSDCDLYLHDISDMCVAMDVTPQFELEML